jgi:opacity protein-like surface antigen
MRGGTMRKPLILLLLIFSAISGYAAQFGVGISGGVNIPIIQEDQGFGTIFGLKGKLNLLPGVSVEPNINFAKFGDAKLDFGSREGSRVTSYGIDAILGSGLPGVGVKMYGLIGAGVYSTTRDYDEDMTKMGWGTGLGLEVGLSRKIGVDIRGKLNVISSQDSSTKKSAAVMGGVNYYFGY